MNKLYKPEFENFYRQRIEPILLPFEKERASIELKRKLGVIPCIIVFLGVAYMQATNNIDSSIVIAIVALLVISSIFAFYMWFRDYQFNKSLKKNVTSKILTLFGNLYFTDKKNAIPYEDIQKWGLFPSSTNKSDDDVIVGLHNGCNFLINECDIYHTRQESDYHGRSRVVRIHDFNGLLVKIQMKKKFTGQTIVGVKGKIKKQRMFEEVNLESVTFMTNRKIYSTDQIEARYLLTTAFMDRLEKLGDNFNYSTADGRTLTDEEYSARIAASSFIGERDVYDVSAAFVGGFVYLFVPTRKDFFEIDMKHSLLDSEQFYSIYNEINSILDIIDFLKLDKNLGL